MQQEELNDELARAIKAGGNNGLQTVIEKGTQETITSGHLEMAFKKLHRTKTPLSEAQKYSREIYKHLEAKASPTAINGAFNRDRHESNRDELLEAINNASREIVRKAPASDIKQHHFIAAIKNYDRTIIDFSSVQKKIVVDLINNADKPVLENLAANIPEGISENTRKFVNNKIEERFSPKHPQQISR